MNKYYSPTHSFIEHHAEHPPKPSLILQAHTQANGMSLV